MAASWSVRLSWPATRHGSLQDNLDALAGRTDEPQLRISSRDRFEPIGAAGSRGLGEREAGFPLRLYCLGEQPMTLLKAVLNALSDS